MILLVFHFMVIAAPSVTEHYQKESGINFLAPTLEIFMCIDEIPSHASPEAQLPQSLLIKRDTPDKDEFINFC